MPDQEPSKSPSLLRNMLDAANATVELQLMKAKQSMVMNEPSDVEDFLFGKAMTEDPSYAIHSSGWKEKPHRLQNAHLKQMSQKDSIVAAVIQTRQNQVSNYSKQVTSEQDRGWMLKLRDEDNLLEAIKDELRGETDKESLEREGKEEKAENEKKLEKASSSDDQDTTEPKSEGSDVGEKDSESDDVAEIYDWELQRKAEAILEEQFKDAKAEVAEHIKKCGVLDKKHKKPFDAAKWNFDSILRAWVRDALTYDLYACEIVPNEDGTPAYFFPVDGSTIKQTSNRFEDYKAFAQSYQNLELLYPENEAKAREDADVYELDPELLEANAYRWVQVIQGKIERAYTEDELKVGIRNLTTDIYNNGYGISELELTAGLVTGHLNAEFYNQAYFTQGFSAKGILHIKSNINRRKLETVRQQWQHMLRGSRNSFQTPIFAGVDDVEWIPLTQNHDDIGFEGWMRYLMKMITAIYQIDSQEINFPFKDDGGGSAGQAGDAHREKMEHSKDKGLSPLLRHLENFINENILYQFDNRFVLHFTGLQSESEEAALERQTKQSKFCKTVNEIRKENGDPPLPGCDNLILGSEYIQWYTQFSEEGKALNAQQMGMGGQEGGFEGDEDDQANHYDAMMGSDIYGGSNDKSPPDKFDSHTQESMGNSDIYGGFAKAAPLKIEYFQLG